MALKSNTIEHSFLITGFLEGNWDCYEKLVLKYFDRAFAYTIRFTKSTEISESIVEQACHKLWAERSHLARGIDFYQCLRRMIGGLILDHLREVAKSKKLQNALWKKAGKNIDDQVSLLVTDQDHIKSLLEEYRKAQMRYKLTTEPS